MRQTKPLPRLTPLIDAFENAGVPIEGDEFNTEIHRNGSRRNTRDHTKKLDEKLCRRAAFASNFFQHEIGGFARAEEKEPSPGLIHSFRWRESLRCLIWYDYVYG